MTPETGAYCWMALYEFHSFGSIEVVALLCLTC